eukprot:XP_001691625.1 predicted protein [Chlamydomonas reinhardtii]
MQTAAAAAALGAGGTYTGGGGRPMHPFMRAALQGQASRRAAAAAAAAAGGSTKVLSLSGAANPRLSGQMSGELHNFLFTTSPGGAFASAFAGAGASAGAGPLQLPGGGASGLLSNQHTGELASELSSTYLVGPNGELLMEVGTPMGAPQLASAIPGLVYPHRRPPPLSRMPSHGMLSTCGSIVNMPSGTLSPSAAALYGIGGTAMHAGMLPGGGTISGCADDVFNMSPNLPALQLPGSPYHRDVYSGSGGTGGSSAAAAQLAALQRRTMDGQQRFAIAAGVEAGRVSYNGSAGGLAPAGRAGIAGVPPGGSMRRLMKQAGAAADPAISSSAGAVGAGAAVAALLARNAASAAQTPTAAGAGGGGGGAGMSAPLVKSAFQAAGSGMGSPRESGAPNTAWAWEARPPLELQLSGGGAVVSPRGSGGLSPPGAAAVDTDGTPRSSRSLRLMATNKAASHRLSNAGNAAFGVTATAVVATAASRSSLGGPAPVGSNSATATALLAANASMSRLVGGGGASGSSGGVGSGPSLTARLVAPGAAAAAGGTAAVPAVGVDSPSGPLAPGSGVRGGAPATSGGSGGGGRALQGSSAGSPGGGGGSNSTRVLPAPAAFHASQEEAAAASAAASRQAAAGAGALESMGSQHSNAGVAAAASPRDASDGHRCQDSGQEQYGGAASPGGCAVGAAKGDKSLLARAKGKIKRLFSAQSKN